MARKSTQDGQCMAQAHPEWALGEDKGLSLNAAPEQRNGDPKEGWHQGGFTQLFSQQCDPILQQDAHLCMGMIISTERLLIFKDKCLNK